MLDGSNLTIGQHCGHAGGVCGSARGPRCRRQTLHRVAYSSCARRDGRSTLVTRVCRLLCIKREELVSGICRLVLSLPAAGAVGDTRSRTARSCAVAGAASADAGVPTACASCYGRCSTCAKSRRTFVDNLRLCIYCGVPSSMSLIPGTRPAKWKRSLVAVVTVIAVAGRCFRQSQSRIESRGGPRVVINEKCVAVAVTARLPAGRQGLASAVVRRAHYRAVCITSRLLLCAETEHVCGGVLGGKCGV